MGKGTNACTYCGPNWMLKILPQLENQALFDSVLACLDTTTTKNVCNDCANPAGGKSSNGVTWIAVGPSKPVNTVPPGYLCPSSNVMMDMFWVRGGFSYPIAQA